MTPFHFRGWLSRVLPEKLQPMLGRMAQSRTLAPIVLVTAGRTAGFGLAMLTNIVLVRTLGPTEYGMFSVGMAMIMILSGIAGEAFDIGLVKHISKSPEHENIVRNLSTSLLLKLSLGLAIILPCVWWSGEIARLFFQSSRADHYVTLVLAGFAGTLLLRWACAYFQGTEQFMRYVAVESAHTAGKFILTMLLLFKSALSALSALLAFAIVPFLVFIGTVKLIPRFPIFRGSLPRDTVATFFHFIKWVMVSFAIATIHSRSDTLLLSYFRGVEAVGPYAAAQVLASIPEIFISFVGAALLPKIMPLYSRGELRPFLRKSLLYTAPCCLAAMLIVLWIAEPLIYTLYSPAYAESVELFQILVVGCIFWWLVIPLASPFLLIHRPDLDLTLNVITLACILGGNIIFIPVYGTVGAAWVALSSKAIVGMIILVLAFRLLRPTAVHKPHAVQLI